MINQLTIDLLKINKFIEQFESGKIKLVDYIGNVYSKNNNFFYKCTGLENTNNYDTLF